MTINITKDAKMKTIDLRKVKQIKTHTIYSNYESDFDEKFLRESLADARGCAESEITEEDMYQEYVTQSRDWFDDARCNLNVTLDYPIILIADVDTWQGRRDGVKILTRNLRDILFADGCEYYKVYTDDDGNVRAFASHHDGTNKYLFRQLKSSYDEELLQKIYDGEVTDEDIEEHTTSLYPCLAKVYGWEI